MTYAFTSGIALQSGSTFTSTVTPRPRSIAPCAKRSSRVSICAISEAISTQKSATETATASFDAVVMATYSRYNIVLTRGSGVQLWDMEKRCYLDCAAGIATCTLGHSNVALQRAVTEQLGKLQHVSNLYYTREQGFLARWLVDRSPADKAFFCNSGGEANEAAIKLVRRYWHNNHPDRADDVPVIICAHNAFHGRTLATLTATGQAKYQRGFWPMMPGFVHCDYNDPVSLKNAADAAGDRLAGIMLEALQGEGGVNPGSSEFFATARNICDDRGALLVCDEVQVGVGRTGKLWGFENVGVQPDVFTLAKGLAGGIPVGAMLCKSKCDVLGPGDHASTFGGNLLACAAGRVVAETLDDGLLDAVRGRGEHLGKRLNKLMETFPGIVVDARGWGLIRGVQLSEDAGFDAPTVVGECIKRGLLLVPAGKTVVRVVPPLIISEEELDTAVDIIEQTIADLSAKL